MQRRSATEWSLLLLLATLWGTAFTFTKIALVSFPPATVAGGRVGLAAVVLVLLVRARGLRLPRERRSWAHLTLIAVTGNVLPFWLISWGQQGIDAGLAGVLMAVMPLATLVLAHYLVEGDRMTPGKVLGFVLGFMGIVVLMGPEAAGELGGSTSNLWRQLAVLGGALCYAVNAIVARRVPAMPLPVLAAGSLLAASLILLPAAALIDRPWRLAVEASSLGALVWLGLIATAAATLVFFRIVGGPGATFLSLINFLIPPIAVVTGMVVLGEQPEPRALIALLLVLGGLLLGQGGRNEELRCSAD